jgi:hypothetical protein
MLATRLKSCSLLAFGGHTVSNAFETPNDRYIKAKVNGSQSIDCREDVLFEIERFANILQISDISTMEFES